MCRQRTPNFLLTLLARGANAASRAGEIGQGLVDGFDQEARRRVANGTFYGAMLFLSLIARQNAGNLLRHKLPPRCRQRVPCAGARSAGTRGSPGLHT
jgi:hypothetical protein